MTRQHCHDMPFGTQLTRSGEACFRLWAPAARQVDLVLGTDAPTRTIPMVRLPQGWFEVTAQAAPGTRYWYRIDGGTRVPDPASRCNPGGVDEASELIDPRSFRWDDDSWRPRPWHEAVVYELNVGTFSPEGTFAGVEARLDHLVQLGISIVELMPVAAFRGARGWGYDGVLPYAPVSAYGRPEDLKRLIAAAHHRGLAVMLDVVYNHFGPEGNYLHAYAPPFFTDRHTTPWGQAINFDGPQSRTVRDFFIHNALYWLEEYRCDGLRLDAVHAIHDDSKPHILTEISQAARSGPGRERPVYLVLENGDNEACWLAALGVPDSFDAQWNDDVHHCLHVLLTGESDGYYEDYAQRPHALLCRALAQGFSYQGDASRYLGRPRGQPSTHLPPTAFVNCLQNHDQIGNRAYGERITALAQHAAAVHAATALLLLAPAPPLLFMGQEWAAPEPFLYFCDPGPDLAPRVRAGRRREFERFTHFQGSGGADTIADPTLRSTWEATCLDWSRLKEPAHAQALAWHRQLLAIRRREILPLIPQIESARCTCGEDEAAFAVDWTLRDGAGTLHLLANLTDHAAAPMAGINGRVIHATHSEVCAATEHIALPPWSVAWWLSGPAAAAAAS